MKHDSYDNMIYLAGYCNPSLDMFDKHEIKQLCAYISNKLMCTRVCFYFELAARLLFLCSSHNNRNEERTPLIIHALPFLAGNRSVPDV